MKGRTELLIATWNPGKISELSELLADLPLRLRGLADFPDVAEVAETGTTFEANARLKATGYAAQTGCWTLADDSGLEVAALGGAPGVLSARYPGPDASDATRVERLLAELATVPEAARGARFVCVIALAKPADERIELFHGTCSGRIADAPRGHGGFGYDPIFIPEGHRQTFGELPHAIKQQISHRARALSQARDSLRRQLTGIA